MARHYSTKAFLRHIPNVLLARYFHEQGLLIHLDFTAMREANPIVLFDAWLKLPEVQRNEMEAAFRSVYEMSCKKGFMALIDEANWQLRDQSEEVDSLVKKLSELPNHYHRAMTAFLDHNLLWKGATHFYHADTLSYWRKRKNISSQALAAVDDESINQLADLIRHYFHRTEGRGNNCLVEVFRRGELDYFFAYPEDHSQQSLEWMDGEFGNRPHNPAFEVVFVYSQKEGSLDLNFRGSYKAIEPLQNMFVTAILKVKALPPEANDDRVYDLNPLCKRNFNFVYDAASGIQSIAVKKLRFSSKVIKGDRLILEADASSNVGAIYDLLDKTGASVLLQHYNVTQVELSVKVVVDVHKPAKRMTIRIAHPSSCSLKYDQYDLKLRKMLESSGIEPKLKENSVELCYP